MEQNVTERPQRNTRMYGLAAICLLLSAGIVYWVRTPSPASAAMSPTTKPAIVQTPGARIQVDPMRQEADGQAAPLLARLHKSPDDADLLAEIGKIYYQMHQFSMAARLYEHLARVKPDAAVLVKLGGAYHFEGNDDKAFDAWNHALRLDPGNPDALFNIGLVQWQARGNRKEAIAAWQKLLDMNPNHPKRARVEELLASIAGKE